MNIVEKINSFGEDLNENDFLIAEFIINNKSLILSMTLDDLSKECNISKTSIIRFTKKIRLSGFSELKALIKFETEKEKKSISDSSNIEDILAKGYFHTINGLRNKNMNPIFDLIENSERVFLYGTGVTQQNAVSELYRIFFNGGKYFYNFSNGTQPEEFIDSIGTNDLVIIVSLSGESSHVVSLATNLKMMGIKIVSLTKLKDNTLARLSDENIYFSNVYIEMTEQKRIYESTTPLFIACEIILIKYEKYLVNKSHETEQKKDGK